MSQTIFSLTGVPDEQKTKKASNKVVLRNSQKKRILPRLSGTSNALGKFSPTKCWTPRTKEACRKLGVKKSELVSKTYEEFAGKNIPREIQTLKYNFNENHRRELLSQVQQERKKLIQRNWQPKEERGISSKDLKKLVLSEERSKLTKTQERQAKQMSWALKQQMRKVDKSKRYSSKNCLEEQRVKCSKKKLQKDTYSKAKVRERRFQNFNEHKTSLEKLASARRKNLWTKMEKDLERIPSLSHSHSTPTLRQMHSFRGNQRERKMKLQRERRHWEQETRRQCRQKIRTANLKSESKNAAIRENNRCKARERELKREKAIKLKADREDKTNKRLGESLIQLESKLLQIELERKKRVKELKKKSQLGSNRKQLLEESQQNEMEMLRKKIQQKQDQEKKLMEKLKKEKDFSLLLKKEKNTLLEVRKSHSRQRSERSERYQQSKLLKRIEDENEKYATRKYLLSKIKQKRRVVNVQGQLAKQKLENKIQFASDEDFANVTKLKAITQGIPHTLMIKNED